MAAIVLLAIGSLATVAGVALLSPPAALIVGGIALLLVGADLARPSRPEPPA